MKCYLFSVLLFITSLNAMENNNSEKAQLQRTLSDLHMRHIKENKNANKYGTLRFYGNRTRGTNNDKRETVRNSLSQSDPIRAPKQESKFTQGVKALVRKITK